MTRLSRFAWIASVFAVGTQMAVCQTLPQLMAKAKRFYGSSRSYEGTITSIGQEKGLQVIRKTYVRCQVQGGFVTRGVVVIEQQKGNESKTRRIIDDGKDVYIVEDSIKKFRKTAHEESTVFNLFESIEQIAEYGGTKAVITEVKDHKDLLATKHVSGTRVEILFDKKTGALLGLHGEREKKGPKDPYDIKISHQVFNGPMPTSIFNWQPPSGYTEVDNKG